MGGASATPTLENGVLHVNYQQVQVMSAILMVGLSPLTKASATAGESQADAPIPDQVWLEAGNGQNAGLGKNDTDTAATCCGTSRTPMRQRRPASA